MRATCIFASITRTREAARNMSLLWLRCSASVLPRVSAMPSPRNCICRVRWESLDRWRHWRSAKSTENSSVSSGMRWGAWLPPFGTARCPLPRLVRKLAAYPRQNQVARALTEVGKLERTAFLLEYFRDAALRRRILIGLNKGEALHALARQLFFGRLGELRDRALEDQIHRASCLHLLMAAIAAWNTIYLTEAFTG